jgi:hypothetical protein
LNLTTKRDHTMENKWTQKSIENATKESQTESKAWIEQGEAKGMSFCGNFLNGNPNNTEAK